MLKGWGHDSKIVPFLSFRTATNSKKQLIEFSAEVPARNAEHKAGMRLGFWCLHQNNLFSVEVSVMRPRQRQKHQKLSTSWSQWILLMWFRCFAK